MAPRPRSGLPARPKLKLELTDELIRTYPPDAGRRVNLWDVAIPGLSLAIQPSGYRSWRFVYRGGGRLRVYTIGSLDAWTLAEARLIGHDLYRRVARGEDPSRDKQERGLEETFSGIYARYLRHAERVNKSWQFSDYLATRFLIPRWAELSARSITHDDANTLLRDITDGGNPILANQVLAVARAIFAYSLREGVGGVKSNPCANVKRNSPRFRDWFLADADLAAIWRAAEAIGGPGGSCVRFLIVTGLRCSEVIKIRRSDVDGMALTPLARSVLPPPSRGPFVFGGQRPFANFGKLKKQIDDRLTDVPPWRFDDLRRTVAAKMHVETSWVHGDPYERHQILTRWSQHVATFVDVTALAVVVR